ncbi:MAG: DUF1428 domain-containing protein [Pararhodobacter sp.]
MTCIQGFICAVPTADPAAFIDHAKMAAEGFRDHGCLDAVECWGGDMPEGEETSFLMAVKAEPEEAVVFSWVQWPDKATRDAGSARMMEDARVEG